jgi:hypothetical protein
MESDQRSLHRASRADAFIAGSVDYVALYELDVVARATSRPNLRPVAAAAVLEKLFADYQFGDEIQYRPLFADKAEHFPLIVADPERLLEIMRLVVDNAVHALNEAKSDLPTIFFDLEQEDGYVKIIIKDNGPGIPYNILPHLFKGITTKGAVLGSGVGLPYCHHMMHKMLGKIDITSKVGQGTEVRITLRTLAAVLILTGQQDGRASEQALKIYLFSGNAQLRTLADSASIRSNHEIVSTEVYQFSEETLDAIDHNRSLLIIDLDTESQAGLRLFDELILHQTAQKIKTRNDNLKYRYNVHMSWNPPTSEHDLLTLIKDTLEEAPKGYLA